MASNVQHTAPAPITSPPKALDHGIRNDVDGLRAVAVLLVIFYHVGFGLFGGGFVGVDIFFVISGFVITRQLFKEVKREGHVSLLGFYARRAKRLLPAASVVLAASAFMTWQFLPKVRWENSGGDIVSSAFYFINWHLIGRSVNYLAEDEPPSIVQHFWSLAIEEQFYLVWPLLILIALWFGRRYAVKRSVSLVAGLAVIAVPSFIYCLYMTHHDPARAYFDTGVRMWEFAIGGFAALLASKLNKMPARIGWLISWTGLVMLLGSGVFYNDTMAWPGSAAVVPTLGAGLLIAGGVAAGPTGPVSLLGTRPMLFLGHISYSMYLWHWPLIIVAQDHYGTTHLSTKVGLAIVVGTIVPAYLTYRFIENPLRYSTWISGSKRAAYSVGLNASLIGAAAGLLLIAGFSQAASATRDVATTPGAAILGQTAAGTTIPSGQLPGDEDYPAIYPNPLKAVDDIPALYNSGCQVDVPTTKPKVCRYGSANARTTIAVVGDSKAAQWVPAFQALARINHWQILTYTKSACSFATITITNAGKPYTQCRTWTDNVIKDLTTKSKPDYVVTVSQKGRGIIGTKDGKPQTSKVAFEKQVASTWNTLAKAGIKVISLGDTPQTGMQVYSCVAQHQKNYFSKCTYDKAKGIRLSGLDEQRAAAAKAHVPFIDMTSFICPPAYKNACPPVIGNVMIYRQGSHITKTYIETMSQQLGIQLRKAGVR
ncbi:acyltransferase family protein [Nocardioides marmorisolisilvae]|uniref:Acyltransferase n=1 Tax=Nocardioides marmorisolisilvae TaxID=1542737 RepID=A0A3N0DIJ9_9ACTN|nr:acyltransferase family protein [Nocardioides marmorisolisilvae]RNL75512.1 acyltransferase [Nocardioides marmorisolisilvae]